jgi:hypothetical protein
VRAHAGVIAIALAAAVAGCGGQGQARGQRTVTYVTRVNAIERQLSVPLQAVTRVSAHFAAPSGGGRKAGAGVAADETALRGALRHIRTLRAQLAAVKAPAAAARLRSLLLRLVNQQAYLTAQTAKLVAFLPTFAAVLRPLAPATLRLEHVLSIGQASGAAAVQAVYAEKAAALRSFQSTLDGMLARLRKLTPPRVMMPNYRAQVTSFAGMSSSAGKLAGVVGSGQTAQVAGLLQAFDRAAAGSQAVSVQKAEAAAVKAYNAQATRVSALTVQAERERLRLAGTLR